MQELTKKTSFYWSRSRRKKFKTAPAPAPKGLKNPAPGGSGSETLVSSGIYGSVSVFPPPGTNCTN